MRVGLLDADIYGPSCRGSLRSRESPKPSAARMLKPIESFGLKVMSIGFLVEEETPMIWRGPMVMSAITQMLREVEWGTLDVLVVDMPPGTGDAQLTLAQQVPLAGAVIVSTPQDLGADRRAPRHRDVPARRRAGARARRKYELFPLPALRRALGSIRAWRRARREAERLGVPFLGEVPLEIEIRETSDAGLPIVATKPDSPHAKIYRGIAASVRVANGGRRKRRAAPRDCHRKTRDRQGLFRSSRSRAVPGLLFCTAEHPAGAADAPSRRGFSYRQTVNAIFGMS